MKSFKTFFLKEEAGEYVLEPGDRVIPKFEGVLALNPDYNFYVVNANKNSYSYNVKYVDSSGHTNTTHIYNHEIDWPKSMAYKKVNPKYRKQAEDLTDI